ncbi:unnamed protein product [Lactuca saligna]|uniref:Uncharacterized protein n=1 Tax=Lactuca saligna TaxID=75948 RepID=A0AA35UJR4_LACSI|nr:unnamed protein product [Lactuca saligna]
MRREIVSTHALGDPHRQPPATFEKEGTPCSPSKDPSRCDRFQKRGSDTHKKSWIRSEEGELSSPCSSNSCGVKHIIHAPAGNNPSPVIRSQGRRFPQAYKIRENLRDFGGEFRLNSIADSESMNMEAKEDYHSNNEASSCNDNSEDDWEAVADRAPDELLSAEVNLSKLRLEDKKDEAPLPTARRGRGTFSYEKHGLYLYSDQQQSSSSIQDDDSLNQTTFTLPTSQGHQPTRDLKYGTRHALVLEGFQANMSTSGLENLLDKFVSHDFVIRWVNDTTAFAVFRTPAIAVEACKLIKCSFTVRVLDENDVLLSSIPEKDLEPPRQRPKTSARTAQRLIAHGMGLKLPSTSFTQKQLKEQEAARKQRILSRQNLKDDAWGGPTD